MLSGLQDRIVCNQVAVPVRKCHHPFHTMANPKKKMIASLVVNHILTTCTRSKLGKDAQGPSIGMAGIPN